MKLTKTTATLILSFLFLSPTVLAKPLYKGECWQAPFCHWTGFYLGLNAGAVNHTMNITDVQATSFLATIQQVSNPRLTGGFQVGYRRQLDLSKASGVYGVEFSANFSDTNFSRQYGSPFALYQLNSQNSLKNVLLLEAIGGIAAERTFLFLAAGLSWVNMTGSTTNLDSIAFFNGFNVDQKELGAALGAGIEYAFSERISARLKVDAIRPNTYSTSDNVNDTFQISNCIIQSTLGVNYKIA